MYFAVSWFEPRLNINQTAVEWTEARTGPQNVSLLLEIGLILILTIRWGMRKFWQIFLSSLAKHSERLLKLSRDLPAREWERQFVKTRKSPNKMFRSISLWYLFVSSGSEWVSWNTEIHLVSRAWDIWTGYLRKTKSFEGNVWSKSQQEQDNNLWTRVKPF